MTDAAPPPQDPGAPPTYQPPYAAQWPGYAATPPGYGYPAYGGYYGDGPPGKIRPTGTSIALVIFTLGIYIFVYNYSVHNEMRRHSGRGIGGGVALLLSFIAYIAMPFVTPAEVGALYLRKGFQAPVSGWTGLWSVVPMLVGYVLQIFLVVFGTVTLTEGRFNDIAIGAILFVFIWLALMIGGALFWFVKTNDALNAYWQSVGVSWQQPPAFEHPDFVEGPS